MTPDFNQRHGRNRPNLTGAEQTRGLLPYAGRLAPSPTGLLHLGHAATFLVAHDRARQAGGRLLLRLDDLDPFRSREAFVEAGKEDLLWLGITWNAELRQTSRMARYREVILQLLALGLAYPCRCSRKDLQQATEAPHEEEDEPIYSGRCRPANLSSGEAAPPGTNPPGGEQKQLMPETNYRFRVPDGEHVCFADRGCGEQVYVSGEGFGDFVVWRRDGLPSYQLASVIDDADAGITEVVRGRDLLRSTARQILLQRALALPTPAYFHTRLLRDEHGQRLAKRHDALSLRSLRAAGVSPAEIRSRVEVLLHHSLP